MSVRTFMQMSLAVGGALLAGCTTQLTYNNDIVLVNTCGVPLEIESHGSSNFLPPIPAHVIAPGERAYVASYLSYGEDVSPQITCSYWLTVKGPERTRTVTADELRYAVAKVKREKNGRLRSWSIVDGSFCP
ncbi:hypothetical protein [Pseudomonas purpurea]|uniref:hypothetical protein n=1 Tax=Pseudomonas purpurea TaxID=3136737 RepID=UPI0032675F92